MSNSTGKGLQAAVLMTLVLGGYWLLRGRHRYDPLSDQFDFDHSPTTRHMVDLKRRVDKEKIRQYLEEERRTAEVPASAAQGVVSADKKAMS